MNDFAYRALVRSQVSLEREFAHDADRWLHVEERHQHARFRSPARQASWLWGRIVAKRLIMAALDDARLYPWEICIHSRSAAGRGIAPTAWVGEDRLPLALSISHAGAWIAAAVSETLPLGVDIVDRSRAHEVDAFPQQGSDLDTAVLWAIREAAFKCCPEGTTFQPRRFHAEHVSGDRYAWSYGSDALCLGGSARLVEHHDYFLALAWQDEAGPQRSVKRRTIARLAEAL